MMRIIVTGGGTGGHLFPGIAFASGMKKRFPQCRILFIGTRRMLDRQTLSGYDFELDSIQCMGLKGMGIGKRIQSVLQLLPALLESRKKIKEFMPDLILGVGGYVTGPVLAAGKLSGVPLCIHEQNSVPGLANKLLARIVHKIFLSIPCRYRFPEGKTLLTGNPVRQEIIDAAGIRDKGIKKERTILVLGGSQGAHRVNTLMTETMKRLCSEYDGEIQVIHQTGTTDEPGVRAQYEKAGVKAEVQAFFRDMAKLYSRADLVVSRAGATTLAELSVMGIPALLIPYPFAADDHQKINALHYEDGGGAKMFLEKELDSEKLAGAIKDLLTNEEILGQMAENMKSMGRPEATNAIIDACLSLMNSKKVSAQD